MKTLRLNIQRTLENVTKRNVLSVTTNFHSLDLLMFIEMFSDRSKMRLYKIESISVNMPLFIILN